MAGPSASRHGGPAPPRLQVCPRADADRRAVGRVGPPPGGGLVPRRRQQTRHRLAVLLHRAPAPSTRLAPAWTSRRAARGARPAACGGEPLLPAADCPTRPRASPGGGHRPRHLPASALPPAASSAATPRTTGMPVRLISCGPWAPRTLPAIIASPDEVPWLRAGAPTSEDLTCNIAAAPAFIGVTGSCGKMTILYAAFDKTFFSTRRRLLAGPR